MQRRIGGPELSNTGEKQLHSVVVEDNDIHTSPRSFWRRWEDNDIHISPRSLGGGGTE